MKYFFIFSFLMNPAFGSCLPDHQRLQTKAFGQGYALEEKVLAIQDELKDFLSPEYEILIRLETLNLRTNAEIKKEDRRLVVEIFGGMLSHPLMTEHSLKLLLCHEIGHVLGGPPLKSREGWSSTEGQADFYSGQTCSDIFGMSEDEFLRGALELTTLYAQVMREPAPSLSQSDGNQVGRINYGYPPVQCRLDTIIAGKHRSPRPLCWFSQ